MAQSIIVTPKHDTAIWLRIVNRHPIRIITKDKVYVENGVLIFKVED